MWYLIIYLFGFYSTTYLVAMYDNDDIENENFVYRQFTFGLLWPIVFLHLTLFAPKIIFKFVKNIFKTK